MTAKLFHTGTQTLCTPRLILRRCQTTDADDMFIRWTSRSDAARFWSWEPHRDAAETRMWVERWILQYDDPSYYHWLIADTRENRPVGYIYLNEIESDGASVHFLIAPAFWNRGYATEACRCIVNHALHAIRFAQIRSRHHEDNPACGKVLLRSGLAFSHSAFRALDPARLNGIYHFYSTQKR